MQMNTQDYLKKALVDTQERIRDFMLYSEKIEEEDISHFFKQYALSEGERARHLQNLIDMSSS